MYIKSGGYSTSKNDGYGNALIPETADQYYKRYGQLLKAHSSVKKNVDKAIQSRNIKTMEQFKRTRFTPAELQGKERAMTQG